MALMLDKIDSAPILGSDMPFEFMQWIWVLIDSLNENIDDLERTVSSITAVTDATQEVDVNTTYIPTNALQTVFSLPDVMDVGARVEIDGEGAGGWQLKVGTGQTIQLPSGPAVASVSVTSSSRYDSISIICVAANTTWIVVSYSTSGFVIV